ncbi:MAG: alpha-ketoglutarate-dependent dioxygenase AlkB [Nannocystaceae bacterium]
MDEPVFSMQTHQLDATHSLHHGFLPRKYRLTAGQVSELWALHPADYHEISIHGRRVLTPRWQQAYGADYHYTGRTNRALPIPALLQPLLAWSREAIYPQLNGLLLNWYDAAHNHYIGRHRDSTKNRVPDSPIVTISFGEDRTFRLREWRGSLRYDFAAVDSSVFVIPFATNLRWTHEVPHFAQNVGRRISLTLRAFQT